MAMLNKQVVNPPAPKVLGRDLPDGTRKRLQVYLGGVWRGKTRIMRRSLAHASFCRLRVAHATKTHSSTCAAWKMPWINVALRPKKIQTRDPRFCSKHATIWLLWQYEKIHSIWTVVPLHIRETCLRTCRPASDPCSVYSLNPRKSERSSFSNVFPASSLCRPFLTTFRP